VTGEEIRARIQAAYRRVVEKEHEALARQDDKFAASPWGRTGQAARGSAKGRTRRRRV
jgi:hypothetical protein